jgi:hypothetical protein
VKPSRRAAALRRASRGDDFKRRGIVIGTDQRRRQLQAVRGTQGVHALAALLHRK